MPKMNIPLLTTSVSHLERTGRPRLGWTETTVNIHTEKPEEFSFCGSTQYGSGVSSTHYVYMNSLWKPVAECVQKPINLEGVGEEHSFHDMLEDFQQVALRSLSLPHVQRLNSRLKENDHSVPLDSNLKITVRASIDPDDAYQEDIDIFQRWCADNLRWVDGVLMTPMLEPSNVISWTYERSRNIKFRTDPILNRYLLQESITGHFHRGNGLHLAADDITWRQKYNAIADQLGIQLPTYSIQDIVGDSAWNKVTATNRDDKLIINGAFIIDPDAYASVSKENRSPMYRRSAASVISAIANSKARRFDVSNIRDIVSMPIDKQGDEFDQALEILLGREELRDTPARIVFADAALEQMSEREIGIRLNNRIDTQFGGYAAR
jgi:hypothetical protein